MDARKFKKPYGRRHPSPKDYDHFKSRPLGSQPLTFPAQLLYLTPVLVQTENNCTAYAAAAIREAMTGKQYDPEAQWREELAFIGRQDAPDGVELQTQLAVGVKTGFTPVGQAQPTDRATAYFWVRKASGLDWFDSLRTAMIQAKAPLSVGVNWYSEWDFAPNGVIPNYGKVLLGGHDIKVAGFETWEGTDYVVLQNSWGTAYGDNGIFRASRDVINNFFEGYGAGYWSDDPDAYVARLGYLTALLAQLQALYESLIGALKAKSFGAMTDPSFTPQINSFAAAIQSFEGYFPPCLRYPFGTAAYRNNNPGNIRYTPYSIYLGATGRSPAGFAKFPTYQAGYHALCQLLTDVCSGSIGSYDPNKGLIAFFQVYAPSFDGNDPIRYAYAVSVHMNIPISTPIRNFVQKVAPPPNQ